ncbi:MAG: hypothetical protein WAW23_07515 [Candidatus Methanoperedens sp.]
MVYDHHYFRKSVEREIHRFEKESRLLIKDYMDSVDELIKEKDEKIKEKDDYIKTLKDRKVSPMQYLIEAVFQIFTFFFGGLWVAAYQNRELINGTIILVTIVYIIIFGLRNKYAGVYS